MLHSVLAANPEDDVRVHYLPGAGITPGDERSLARMVERAGGSIAFLRVPRERLAAVPTEGFTREATWYRIFLPELLPDVSRVLYLDADVIVLGRLAPLWELDLSGAWVGAVTNLLEPIYKGHPAELGIPPDQPYFNAGVLLMNLDAMRSDGCTEALLDYARVNAARLMWRDQDALNAVLGGRRLALHPRWNLMNSMLSFPDAADVLGGEALAEALADPAIRHFEGPADNKPWHLLCGWEGRDLYRRHRRQTPWPRTWPEGVTPRNVVRRLGLGRGSAATHSLEDR
jgi:lipopolysaccharide biosynthesis glycosyltransferase